MHPRLVFPLALLLACSGRDRAPLSGGWDPGQGGTAGQSDGGGLIDVASPDGPPPPDAQGLCGNFFFKVSPEPPNLYFVLDRSGSMLEKSGLSGLNRYDAVRFAVLEVERTLRDRAAYGVTLFPGNPVGNGCATGTEVFETRLGDPMTLQGDGPVIKALASAINHEPVGGTPTSKTLSLLVPKVKALKGKTAVVLATDGGPNCNGDISCGTSECTYNIENGYLDGKLCTGQYNCCDPNIIGGPGDLMCVDSIHTIEAVQALRDAGIRTFVVGIPGSAYYATLLNQLAVIGGSARPAQPYYFKIDDMNELSSTLLQIGTRMLLTCTFVIDQPPPDTELVNVYFDGEALAYDEDDGWTWTSDTSLTVHGEACKRLEDGLVGNVQVVAGCPTKQPR
jgi:hypothetical protein